MAREFLLRGMIITEFFLVTIGIFMASTFFIGMTGNVVKENEKISGIISNPLLFAIIIILIVIIYIIYRIVKNNAQKKKLKRKNKK